MKTKMNKWALLIFWGIGVVVGIILYQFVKQQRNKVNFYKVYYIDANHNGKWDVGDSFDVYIDSDHDGLYDTNFAIKYYETNKYKIKEVKK